MVLPNRVGTRAIQDGHSNVHLEIQALEPRPFSTNLRWFVNLFGDFGICQSYHP